MRSMRSAQRQVELRYVIFFPFLINLDASKKQSARPVKKIPHFCRGSIHFLLTYRTIIMAHGIDSGCKL